MKGRGGAQQESNGLACQRPLEELGLFVPYSRGEGEGGGGREVGELLEEVAAEAEVALLPRRVQPGQLEGWVYEAG